MDRMNDKVVVVTGAAHGIGAAIARRFADEGAVLALLESKKSPRTCVGSTAKVNRIPSWWLLKEPSPWAAM